MGFLNVGPGELLLVLALALIILGPAKLPELARSMGKGIGEFRRATTEVKQEFTSLGLPEIQRTSSDTQRTCRRCGTTNPSSSRFCGQCGFELKDTEKATVSKTCADCGAQNEPGNKYCNGCGQDLTKESAQQDCAETTPPVNSRNVTVQEETLDPA